MKKWIRLLLLCAGALTLTANAQAVDSDGDGIVNTADLDDDNDGILDTQECSSKVVVFLEDFNGYVSQATPVAPLSNPDEETEIPYQEVISGSVPPSGWYAVTLQPQSWFSSLRNFNENAAMSFDGSHGNSGERLLFKAKNITLIAGNDYEFSFKYWAENTILPTLSLYVDEDGAAGPKAPQLLKAVTLTGGGYDYKTAVANWAATADSSNAEFYIMLNNYSGGSGGRNFQLDDIKIERFDCDLDRDGIPNHLDLDSDNDGCLDAIEGAGNFTNADVKNAAGTVGTGSSASNQNLGNNVDANGVPTVAGATGQDIGTSQDAAQQAVECDACNPNSTLFTDADGDGIGDKCDLDDDNDGILDTVEDGCGGNLVQNPSFEAQNFLDVSVGNVWDPYGTYFGQNLNSDQLTGWTYTTNLDGWSDSDPSMAAAAHGDQYIDVLGNNTRSDPPGTANVLSQIIATEAGQSYTFSFYWGEDMGHIGNNVSVTNLTASVIDNASNTVIKEQNLREMAEGNASGIRGPKHWNFYTVTFVATSAQTKIQFTAVATDVNQSNGAALDMVTVKKICDSDGDGIPNHLDLDSDNDGCLDAIEGAGTFKPADLVAAQGTVTVGTGSSANNQNLGNAVDTNNGIPTVANGGQAVGTAQDATLKSPDCCELVLTPDSGAGTVGTPFTVPNILVNDTLDGTVPVIGTNLGEVVISQEGTWPAGITLDPDTGDVNVDGTVPAGTYPVEYEVCVNGTQPLLCKTETVTITVADAPIDAVNDDLTATPVNGANGGEAGDALANDTLNGQPVTAGEVNITTTTSPQGITVDANGNVQVPAGTPAGEYTVVYKICEKLNPTNCDTAEVKVKVVAPSIDAKDDDLTASPVDGANGGEAGDALANDTLNGQPVTASEVNITTTTSPQGITVDADGNVRVPAGTPAGEYTVVYQICEKANPTNCDTAEVKVKVAAPAIDAVNDDMGTVPGGVATTTTTTVFDNDTLNGQPIDLNAVNFTPTPFTQAGVTLNVNGTVTVADNVPAGIYTTTYKICEKFNPANCETATVSITVGASATDDTATGVAGQPVTIDVTANDSNVDPTTVQLIDPATGNPSTSVSVSGEGTWTVDPNTGAVTFTPVAGFTGTPTPMTYQVTDNNGNTLTASCRQWQGEY